MTLAELRVHERVIGIKQVTKAVTKGVATCVFTADDADARVLAPLVRLCTEKDVAVVHVPTMKELGRACAIEVGAAAAAHVASQR